MTRPDYRNIFDQTARLCREAMETAANRGRNIEPCMAEPEEPEIVNAPEPKKCKRTFYIWPDQTVHKTKPTGRDAMAGYINGTRLEWKDGPENRIRAVNLKEAVAKCNRVATLEKMEK